MRAALHKHLLLAACIAAWLGAAPCAQQASLLLEAGPPLEAGSWQEFRGSSGCKEDRAGPLQVIFPWGCRHKPRIAWCGTWAPGQPSYVTRAQPGAQARFTRFCCNPRIPPQNVSPAPPASPLNESKDPGDTAMLWPESLALRTGKNPPNKFDREYTVQYR